MNNLQLLREKVKDLKVLFVDDDKDIRDGTSIFLRKFFDDVVVCANGEEGLAEFRIKKEFDVIITDILMPIMNGVEMIKEIRKVDSNVFILVLTASRSTNNFDKLSIDMILQKPLSFDDMVLVMQKLGE